jgi:DNA-binding SARP family transcriptional activator/tRNA A-37 threonylcarbamoyl transferase component Bud32
MGLHIKALGGLQFSRDGAPIALPSQRRIRTALAVYLAIEREVTRERVLSVFWPDSTEENARHALSQALYDLRQHLGEWLHTTPDGLQITPEVHVDSHDFERAVMEGDYHVALTLYSGPLLNAVDKLPNTKGFETWLDGQRAHFERLHRTARRRYIGDQTSKGNLTKALDAAREWASLTPLEDEAQHRLIELLAESGQPLEAIRQYEVYERLLKSDELTPLEDTKTLIARIKDDGMRLAISRPHVVSAPADGLFPPDLEVIRPLGTGSVATVLLARETTLKRLVAVKVLREDLAADEVVRQRFEREAQAAATISHPNVTAIYRVGRLANSLPFIVMEYIDGSTLEDALAAEGAFSVAQCREIMRGVALALAEAHRKGVIHRHVSPSNVLLENNSARIVLADFGFAALLESGQSSASRLTRAGERIGDPRRMSPEQRNGEHVTQHSDVYALGLLGYELMIGKVPNDVSIPPHEARSGVDGELSDLIMRCLNPSPRRRPDAQSIADRLSRKDVGETLDAGSHPWRDFFRELRKRKVVGALIGYIAAAFVVLQGAQLVLPGLPINDLELWYRGIVALTLAGFPVALVMSWLFEWTGDGVQRTHGGKLRGAGVFLAAFGLLASAVAAFGVWWLLMR